MIRVSRRKPCPICDKPDWCLVATDGSAAICQRVESDKPVGTKGAGWLHRLNEDLPPMHYVERKPRTKIQRDWPAIAEKYHAAMTGDGWSVLADDLGLSVETLKAMQVGWDGSQSRYTFPMRNDAGDIVGIRTRDQDGKRSVSGSDGNGLFFIPSMLSSDHLIICEGPTDMAALVDAGFGSAIGKPSCKLGDDYAVALIQRLRPAAVLLIPDRDAVGLQGFAALANKIVETEAMPMARIDAMTPPAPLKDARQWLRKSRDHLVGRIAAKLEAIKTRNGDSNHDRP